jgi:hypothetical protein
MHELVCGLLFMVCCLMAAFYGSRQIAGCRIAIRTYKCATQGTAITAPALISKIALPLLAA